MGRGAGAPLLEERPNHTKHFRHYKFNLSPVSISLECGALFTLSLEEPVVLGLVL